MNIREVQVRYRRSEIPRSRFSNSREIYASFRDDMMSFPVEVFRAVFLNSKNIMISFEDISRGSLTGAVVMPREAFWSAIHFRSAAVIFLHNHPSGCSAPSAEDRECTARLVKAGSILGIRVLDHIVIGAEDYFSFADAGLIDASIHFNAASIGEKNMKTKKKSMKKTGAANPGRADNKAKKSAAAETKAVVPETTPVAPDTKRPPDETKPPKKETIKQLVIGQILGNPAVTNKDLIAAVKARFPESAFKDTHAAWYRSQARKGALTGTPIGIPQIRTQK